MGDVVYRDNAGDISGKPITLGVGAKVVKSIRLPMEDFRKGVASPAAAVRAGVATDGNDGVAGSVGTVIKLAN